MVLSSQTIIISISHGMNAIISAALMMLVLWQAPRLRSNQLFALMMFFLSIHSVLNVAGRFFQPLGIAPTPTYRLILTLNLLGDGLMFPFVMTFAGLKGRRANIILLYDAAISLLALAAINSGLVFTDMYALPDGGFNAIYGPLAQPLMVLFFIYLVITTMYLYRAEEARARRMWPAFALIIGGFLSLIIRPIIPLPLNSIFLAASSLWMGYVVLNDQLFNPLVELNRDLAAANAELAAANQLKNQFLANMSHELRTPLNSVIGYTELVINEVYGPLTEPQKDRLQRVARNGRHLLGLINDILDLSKVEAGRMILQLEAVNAGVLIENVLTAIEPMANEKKVAIVRDFASVPAILADDTRMEQVFMNLLSNAVKFTREGSVTIHAERDPDQHMVHFTVSDTGIGIPADKQDMIFEEFRQVDQSSTRRYQGTGLGLSITRHLVELQGGTIWLESAVGKGSTFHVTIPIAPQDEAAAPDPASDESPLTTAHKNPTIMTVNADPERLRMLFTRLTGQGINVIRAPQHASTSINSPELIVLDADDTGLTGWHTLGALKANPVLTRTPVLILNSKDTEPHANRLNTQGVLVKPLKQIPLLATLHRHLDGQHSDPVLVVDGDEAERKLLNNMLANAGFRVVTLGEGQSACDWLSTHRASLVILDLLTPGLSGLDVLQFIRDNQDLAAIPVLLTTVNTLSSEGAQALHRQCTAFIQKGGPVQDLLLAEVKESLNAYEYPTHSNR